jgi:hypothetical protein
MRRQNFRQKATSCCRRPRSMRHFKLLVAYARHPRKLCMTVTTNRLLQPNASALHSTAVLQQSIVRRRTGRCQVKCLRQFYRPMPPTANHLEIRHLHDDTPRDSRVVNSRNMRGWDVFICSTSPTVSRLFQNE